MRRRTHPGLPEGWDDPPSVDLPALAFRSTYTSPVVPEGSAGDARCGSPSGCPARCQLTPPPVSRRRCPPPQWVGCPTLRNGVGPLVRLPGPLAPAPFTLTRLPVPTPVAPAEPVPRSQLGCFLDRDSAPRCPWPPASRWLGASKLASGLAAPANRHSSSRDFPSARRAGEPALVASEQWLLAPSGTAFASWTGHVFLLGQPEGLPGKTRSLGPGLHALSGTGDTFADTKPQVKGYF